MWRGLSCKNDGGDRPKFLSAWLKFISTQNQLESFMLESSRGVGGGGEEDDLSWENRS